MIGLSVSMRCAGPGSWIKVVHLPSYLSRAIQCLSLVHALGIRRTFTTSEREKRDPLVTTLPPSRMETSSSMMPRNSSGDFLSRGRRSLMRSGSALRATDVRPPVVGRYCNKRIAARYQKRNSRVYTTGIRICCILLSRREREIL